MRLQALRFTILAFAFLAVQPPISPSQNPPYLQNPPPLPRRSPEDEVRLKIERDMAKKANEERQANLKRDTDKLLKLATELKDYVDKTDENKLSVDVVKKAEEIEKLAHSVKDKMKSGY